LGKDVVTPFRQTTMGAEDFAFFVDQKHGIPGYYFAVGGSNPAWIAAAKNGGKPVAGHHSPLFKIDPEPSVRLGIEATTAAVLDLLGPSKN
jgi:hippurate hydrolase